MRKKVSNKMFFIIILLLIIGLFSISTLGKIVNKIETKIKEREIINQYNEESKYDVYITNGSKDISLIQIKDIKKNNIVYSKIDNINPKYEEASFLYIDKDKYGKIYVSYSKDNKEIENTKRILVFNKAKLEDEIYLEDISEPQDIIIDRENNNLYVQQVVKSPSENSDGIKVKVIDTISNNVIDELLVKGYIRDYYVGNNEIILNLEGAKELGFKDAQDRSLYAINKNALEGKVITKESLINPVSAICQDINGNNIIFSNLSVENEKEKNEIIIFDNKGNFKGEKEVSFNMSNNFYGNEKYQYMLNGKYPFENNGFLVFNKESREFETLIDDVKNISYIESENGYIFVLSSEGKLAIYDQKNLEKIGFIDVGNKPLYRMKVIKR